MGTKVTLLAGLGLLLLGCADLTPGEKFAAHREQWLRVRSTHLAQCAGLTSHRRPWRPWHLWFAGDGPTRLCSRTDQPLPTFVRGDNAASLGAFAIASYRPDMLEVALTRLEDATHELRSGGRGWLAEDFLPGDNDGR